LNRPFVHVNPTEPSLSRIPMQLMGAVRGAL
jgi:hypothetical protein